MSLSNIRVEKSLLKSLAFKKLSGSGKYIYFQFLIMRKFSKVGDRWICTNSEELVFTYEDAKEKHGYSSTKFLRAIDELAKYGFIKIVHHGGKVKGNYTLYGLSEKWERFGKKDFEPEKRRKIFNGSGFVDKQFIAHKNDSQE